MYRIRPFCVLIFASLAYPAGAAQFTVVNQGGYATVVPRAPLPQEELQGSREQKARQHKNYEAVEEGLLESRTPQPEALTREDIEAIIDEKMGRAPPPAAQPPQEMPNKNFGGIGGLGQVGGIGVVGGVGNVTNIGKGK